MRKIKFLFFMTFSLLVVSLFSQTTGNFNYQAVVRDNNGDLIANQSISVQLSIIESIANGTEIYKEAHLVTSTSNGLINLLVGNGTSSLGDFTSINWGLNSKFIKVEIDAGNGFVDMGTFQLFSVPYALNANSANKLGDENIYSPIADTLFVVKDHDGNVVFAVFPDGAAVYVNETAKGGGGGGFSVSGRSPGKATGEPCLLVTSDSTRIYVNEPAKGGGGGGFSVSGRSPGKAGSSSFLNLTPKNYYIGHEAGINTTTGLYNSFIGYKSGYLNTEGCSNVFLGRETGYNNISGYSNVFIGDTTGKNNTTGHANVFVGQSSGSSNTNGYWNIFLGRRSGFSNTDGFANIIIGDWAGLNNKTGDYNVMVGDYAGASNTSGNHNIFIGPSAGWSNDTGKQNVFVGSYSGFNNVSGNFNTYVGVHAGGNNVNGHENVFLGYGAGYYETGSNKLYIDNDSNDSTNAIIYGDFLNSELRFNAKVGIGGVTVDSCQLYIYGDACTTGGWETSSDERWKTNIYTLNNSLEKVLKLRGVSYNWKNKEFPNKKFGNGKQIGFIAQELEKVIPEVVKLDDDGYRTVDYSKLTSYLVEAVKEQQKNIGRLEKNNEMLKRELNILKSKVEKLLNENTQPRMASPNFGD